MNFPRLYILFADFWRPHSRLPPKHQVKTVDLSTTGHYYSRRNDNDYFDNQMRGLWDDIGKSITFWIHQKIKNVWFARKCSDCKNSTFATLAFT